MSNVVSMRTGATNHKVRVGSAQTAAPGWEAAEHVFKPLAETKSHSCLSIEPHGGGILGSAQQQLDMVSHGLLELTYVTSSYLTRYVPWVALFDLPFNWNSPTEFLRDSYSTVNKVNRELVTSDMEIVGLALVGTRGFFGNKLIRTPEDCEGLTFRYHAPGVGPKFCEQFGGKPVVFGLQELHTAFEQGRIHITTCITPLAIIALKLYEVAQYLSVSGHAYATCYYVANRTWLRTLPTDIRETFLDSLQAACDWANAQVLRKEKVTYDDLKTKYGVEVIYLTPGEKVKFKALTPPVYKFAEQHYGKEKFASICKIKVLVADPYPVSQEGMCQLLEQEGDIRIVARPAKGAEVVTLAKELAPDVAIILNEIPKANAIEMTKDVKNACSSVAVIVIDTHASESHLLAAVRAGADAYLPKEVPVAELLSTLRSVFKGDTAFDHETTGKVLRKVAAGVASREIGVTPLRDRELEVLKLVIKGMRNKEIALQLAISERTVQSHLKNIFEKTGVNSRINAVTLALKEGWLCMDDLPTK